MSSSPVSPIATEARAILKSMRHKLYSFISLIVLYLAIPRNMVYCIIVGLRPDLSWRFSGLPWVRIGGRGSVIKIGHRFCAVSKIANNSFGIIQRVMIRTVGHGAEIVIGDNVGVSGCSISAAQSIHIGNNVLIGSGAIISDNDAHPIDPEERLRGSGGLCRPVRICDNVFIGARAIILKGVTVGEGSVVGAGAVVAKDVPPFSIVVGNPARVIGDSRKVV